MAKETQPSDLGKHLGYWLRFVSNHVSYAFKAKVEAKGVTVAEWVAMRELFSLGECNPSRLADRMAMTRGAISKLVDRLAKKKLVTRTAASGDGRFQTIDLTPAGRKLVPVLARLADENDAEYFGHLTKPQQGELVDRLKELVDRHGWKNVPTE